VSVYESLCMYYILKKISVDHFGEGPPSQAAGLHCVQPVPRRKKLPLQINKKQKMTSEEAMFAFPLNRPKDKSLFVNAVYPWRWRPASVVPVPRLLARRRSLPCPYHTPPVSPGHWHCTCALAAPWPPARLPTVSSRTQTGLALSVPLGPGLAHAPKLPPVIGFGVGLGSARARGLGSARIRSRGSWRSQDCLAPRGAWARHAVRPCACGDSASGRLGRRRRCRLSTSPASSPSPSPPRHAPPVRVVVPYIRSTRERQWLCGCER